MDDCEHPPNTKAYNLREGGREGGRKGGREGGGKSKDGGGREKVGRREGGKER